jgi:hypothetical protein
MPKGSPASSPGKKAVKPPSATQLRQVFDRFDKDGSGAVSIEEMEDMLKTLKLNFPSDKLRKLMRDADPDGSGQIEFKEFSSALRKQIREGGALADVVSEASTAFGWLNPASWFTGEEESEPAAASSPTRPSPSRIPKRSPPSKKKTSPRTVSERSPTHRMKKTQNEVQLANHHHAVTKRAASEAAKNWWKQQQDDFLAGQHEKVEKGHREAVERVEAVEALKRMKREIGSVMRKELENKWRDELAAKRERVAVSHSAVFEKRKAKQGKVRARLNAERENAIAIGEAAKVERATRREKNTATVRRELEAAKTYTARVRYETRPEVREEGRDLYQAMRDDVAEEARKKLENDRALRNKKMEAYLARADAVKQRVETLRESSKASRENLVRQRSQSAKTMRNDLGRKANAKAMLDEEMRQQKKSVHDDILTWSKTSVTEPDEVSSLMAWQNFGRSSGTISTTTAAVDASP